MKKQLSGLLAVGLLVGPMAAHAVTITYSFTVLANSGPLDGQHATGHFSFDSSIIPVNGGPAERGRLFTDLSFTWDGVSYDETTANTSLFQTGLSFSDEGILVHWLFGGGCPGGWVCGVPGRKTWTIIGDPEGSLFQYTTEDVGAAPGGIATLRRIDSIAEPGSLALLGLGLLGLGVMRRRAA
jgi:hypothetical protein